MLRLFKTPEKFLGNPPGTLSDDLTGTSFLASCTRYSEDEFEHFQCGSVRECIDAIKREDTTNWLNVTGMASHDVLKQFGEELDMHDLVLEDIQNSSEPLKFEEYDNFVFIVAKSLVYNHTADTFNVEDTKIIVGRNYLITFNAVPVPMYLKLFKRLSQKNTRLRKMGIPYFLFALLDVLSDSSYLILNKIIDRTEKLEIMLQENFKNFDATEIYRIKQLMSHAKRSLWGYMEILNNIKISDFLNISDEVMPYYQDLEDHYKHMRNIVDSVYSAAQDMFNLYISMNSQQMNEVMKILTIFSAVFIPMTFIASVYGMNFDNMPGLRSPMGFTVVIGIMVVVAGFMLAFLRRRNWL